MKKELEREAEGRERSLFDSVSSSSSLESEEEESVPQTDVNTTLTEKQANKQKDEELKELRAKARKKKTVYMEQFTKKYNRMSYIEKAIEFDAQIDILNA